MSLSRFYFVKDMVRFPDKVEEWDGVSAFKFPSAPAWFLKQQLAPLFPDLWYPNFTVSPPQGTTGTYSFAVEKYSFPAGVLLQTGTITINVLPWGVAPWNANLCEGSVMAWLNPIGGWETYTFTGNRQPFQDDGTARTFINSDGQKRYTSRDEVHQGVIASVGNLNAIHSRQISDLFKTIQAFISTSTGWKPIIIEPTTFRQVASNEPWRSYEFEYRLAEEDVIQTQ